MPFSQRISASGSQEFVCDRLFPRPTVPWQRLTRWGGEDHVDHRWWLRLYHTSEVGGTGWNYKKFHGNRWNHKEPGYLLAAIYYIPPFFSRAFFPLPFSGISSSLLLSHLSSSILLNFFQITSCPLFFLFVRLLSRMNDFVVEIPAFFRLFFLRTGDQSRCKRYVLNGDVHHVEF